MKNFIQQMGAGTRPGKAGQAHDLEKPGRHKTCPYGENCRLRVGAPLVGARNQNQQGLTLIELIVVMIVISVALVGVMSVINYTTRHSADPVLRHQAIAIAEAYMEEIVLKDFANPPGGYSGTNRSLFDDISDYHNLTDDGARNQNGQVITGLENYRVSVSVIEEAFGPAGNTVDALRIDVTVRSPAGEEITLTSYRTDY